MNVSSSIGVYIDTLRGTQMSDRQIHKKTKTLNRCRGDKKNACVWCLPLCVCISRVMTHE